jgi:hypothetical protein
MIVHVTYPDILLKIANLQKTPRLSIAVTIEHSLPHHTCSRLAGHDPAAPHAPLEVDRDTAAESLCAQGGPHIWAHDRFGSKSGGQTK